MSLVKLDLVAFSPHPDDAELCCGGLLAKMSAGGHRVGIVDLTQGELATNGSVESRAQEAAEASEILGLAHRENLALPDGSINSHDELQVTKVVHAIRKFQPSVVLVPYKHGRHPDHVAASELVTKAVFMAGLSKFAPSDVEAFRPSQVLYYMMRYEFRPSFVVDITSSRQQKDAAINCYASQMNPDGSHATGETLISASHALGVIETRDRYFGTMIGTSYGEPFLVHNALSISDPIEFFEKNPNNTAHIFPRSE